MSKEIEIARQAALEARRLGNQKTAEIVATLEAKHQKEINRLLSREKRLSVATWLSGVGKPQELEAENDDLYIDTFNGDVYVHRDNAWNFALNILGAKGKDGEKGEPGKDGKAGEKGKDGENGKDGTNGKDGKDGAKGKDGKDGKNGKNGKDGKNGESTRWYTDFGAPKNSLGNIHDFYLDKVSADYFEKTDNLHWTRQGNLRGRSGGGGIVSGSGSGSGEGGAVDSVNGQTGDVVLDTDDIADTSAHRYTNDTDVARLADTSGVNTGDQDVPEVLNDLTDVNASSPIEGEVLAFISGAWQPYALTPTIAQAVIDFGTTGTSDEVFTITDASISPTSKIIASVSWNDTLERDPDEIMADPITLSIEPLAGSMNVYAMALEGSVSGKYAINYQIG